MSAGAAQRSLREGERPQCESVGCLGLGVAHVASSYEKSTTQQCRQPADAHLAATDESQEVPNAQQVLLVTLALDFVIFSFLSFPLFLLGKDFRRPDENNEMASALLFRHVVV